MSTIEIKDNKDNTDEMELYKALSSAQLEQLTKNVKPAIITSGAISISFIVAGIILFIFGATGQFSLEGSTLGGKVSLVSLSPGIFCFVIALVNHYLFVKRLFF